MPQVSRDSKEMPDRKDHVERLDHRVPMDFLGLKDHAARLAQRATMAS